LNYYGESVLYLPASPYCKKKNLSSATNAKVEGLSTHRKSEMRATRRCGEFLPLGDVAGRNRLHEKKKKVKIMKTNSSCKYDTHAVVRAFSGIAQERLDLGHGANPDDTLDRKVGLVSQGTRKVIRADLIRRDETVRNEELGPLVEERGLRGWVAFSPR
jgi:hypothetical protein